MSRAYACPATWSSAVSDPAVIRLKPLPLVLRPRYQYMKQVMTTQSSTRAFFASSGDEALWEQARALREQYWGRSVFFRGIVEFSSYCERNCLYCGLRRENMALARYRLSPEEIFRAASDVHDLGIGTVVLQSGEDSFYDARTVAALARRIKTELGLAVTLSLGERSTEEYALWRAAGADRYLLKMETFLEANFRFLRPDSSPAARAAAYADLQKLGFECGNGIILGLPGETGETDEADEADETGGALAIHLAALQKLAPSMLAISPFIPHPDTPLADHPSPELPVILRAMARARIALPSAHIPVTSALGLLGDDIRIKALEVGDVLMPSLTPEQVRAGYSIYPGKNDSAETPVSRAKRLMDAVARAGFAVPSGPAGRGDAWKAQ
ncbi:radical SAM protein [Desulfovibrio sp. OttesenSCG-928-I05]|nr:radical SAM protein [Desulfovibrio sp. OttesenSCG-928-I05]